MDLLSEPTRPAYPLRKSSMVRFVAVLDLVMVASVIFVYGLNLHQLVTVEPKQELPFRDAWDLVPWRKNTENNAPRFTSSIDWGLLPKSLIFKNSVEKPLLVATNLVAYSIQPLFVLLLILATGEISIHRALAFTKYWIYYTWVLVGLMFLELAAIINQLFNLDQERAMVPLSLWILRMIFRLFAFWVVFGFRKPLLPDDLTSYRRPVASETALAPVFRDWMESHM